MFLRHRFRVDGVSVETSDVVSIHVGGRRLERLNARPGQYFRVRLLKRNEWWRSHPFSLSAVPDGDYLRFSVKALGDFSERVQALRPGVRVILEGPYGALTSDRRTGDSVALIGGGIGVSPIRALFEELAGRIDVTLVYRASRSVDLVFADELADLERRTGARIRWLVGRRGTPAMPSDPLEAASLRRLIPDIASRDVFICGPIAMMDALERTLRELGVPSWRVHTERFA
jgi:ferredoxin-NADP reductase